MKYISSRQLADSLRLLSIFRSRVNSQGVQHILPFLALRRNGVNTSSYTPYAESDDFEFFDEYARIGQPDLPYFDPIAGIFRIATHPHSNIATARKGTFFRSWHAASYTVDAEEGHEVWKLDQDYLQIIREKALTKGGETTLFPVLPLAAFLFRDTPFPRSFKVRQLGKHFKTKFNLTDIEYTKLFEDKTRIPEFSADSPMSESDILEAIQESGVVPQRAEKRSSFQDLIIDENDEVLKKVRMLIEDGYAGVVFVGPPGTSKSWYAVQIALALTEGDASRVRKIQFHKSFQYEDFVEGFFPNPEGTGFELRDQLMLRLVSDAESGLGSDHVVLIDELSRSDPGRVFGELLTYMEPSRRGESFLLASGKEISIPPNIVFLATMNSRDKGVVDIDDAFDRRLAKIEFDPKEVILNSLLDENTVDDNLRRRIVGFFNWVQSRYPLGHTFFRPVRDIEGLKRLWETQLRFIFEKQFKYEPSIQNEIREKFVEITGITFP